jgi:hypothetical protein
MTPWGAGISYCFCLPYCCSIALPSDLGSCSFDFLPVRLVSFTDIPAPVNGMMFGLFQKPCIKLPFILYLIQDKLVKPLPSINQVQTTHHHHHDGIYQKQEVGHPIPHKTTYSIVMMIVR